MSPSICGNGNGELDATPVKQNLACQIALRPEVVNPLLPQFFFGLRTMSELICLSLVNICTQGWKRFALNVFQDSGIEFLPEQLSGRVERGEGRGGAFIHLNKAIPTMMSI